MKKLLSLALALTLLLGLALPAGAADSAEDRLSRVTAAVKEKLDLDTAAYDRFQGACDEGELTPVWNLYWSNDSDSLSIEALEDGTVVSYRPSQDAPSATVGGIPTYPTGSEAAAKAAAEAFLQKALRAGETAEIGESRSAGDLYGSGYYFSGELLLNGVASPLSWSITVGADGQIQRFRRDVQESTWLGALPGATPAVTSAAALASLRTTHALKLEYVRDGEQAVLRYVPEYGHSFYVDAQTGEIGRAHV